MNMHKNARMTPIGRERLVQAVLSGQTPEAAGQAAGVCPRTARKWISRFKAEGRAGLMDRSSRPKRLYRPTPAAIVEQVEVLRRQRFTGKQIAANLAVSPATVSRLRRLGLNWMRDLEPAEMRRDVYPAASMQPSVAVVEREKLHGAPGLAVVDETPIEARIRQLSGNQ
jgi:transposase